MQPALFVTVTVYIPAAVTLFVDDVPPPLQAYVTPVDGLAVNVTLVTLQLKSPLLAALAVGAVVFELTVTLAVELHPFELSVTVTVYVPAAVTIFVDDVPPPLQAYVTPVDGLAVNVTLVTLQLKSPLLAALAVGAVVFELTVTLAVELHPLALSVTVTVYVPAAVTLFVDDVPPPLQAYVTPRREQCSLR